MIGLTSEIKRLFPQLFITLIFIALIILTGCTQRANTFFEKELSYPDLLTSDQKIKLAAYVIPTEKQYEWQQLELTAFIHFGMNTFTGRESGNGSEDPELFNPTNFDAEQWIVSLYNAGFRMIVITAKHSDGFCLWPTQTTTHSVSSSPWLNGNGDIIKAVKDAADKYDMKFGLYLSPADNYEETYAQLIELLTNYGEIDMVWVDSEPGEDHFNNVVDSLQPNSVKAVMGGDVRWAGNEDGFGRETQWSVTPLRPEISKTLIAENNRLNITPTTEDLGSNELIIESKSIHWYPSFVNVSIRPGLFYHPQEDHQIKTLAELVDIYFHSVGMNSVLLLNIPPDTRGRLHELDVERLQKLGSYISNTFEDDKIIESEIEWKPRSGSSREFEILQGDSINTVLLQEDIQKGQRVEEFTVEGLINDEWVKLAEGTTIGYKRLLRFRDTYATKIRVTIEETRDIANIKKVGAYYAPVLEGSIMKEKLSDLTTEKWKVNNPQPLTIDLGESYSLKGFTYSPDDIKESLFKYIFFVSDDGENWTEISNTEFSNIKNDPNPQTVSFDEAVNARYIKLESVEGVNGGIPAVDMEQIGILLN